MDQEEIVLFIHDEWMKRPKEERRTREQAEVFLFQLTEREPQVMASLAFSSEEVLEWLVPDHDRPLG
jgi:hypothetical protein